MSVNTFLLISLYTFSYSYYIVHNIGRTSFSIFVYSLRLIIIKYSAIFSFEDNFPFVILKPLYILFYNVSDIYLIQIGTSRHNRFRFNNILSPIFALAGIMNFMLINTCCRLLQVLDVLMKWDSPFFPE